MKTTRLLIITWLLLVWKEIEVGVEDVAEEVDHSIQILTHKTLISAFQPTHGNPNSFCPDLNFQNQGNIDSSRDTKNQNFQNPNIQKFRKDPNSSTQVSLKNS